MPNEKSGAFDMKAYIRDYQREYIFYKKLNLNSKNEADMELARWLDSWPEGTSNYLKRLVREDMSKTANS